MSSLLATGLVGAGRLFSSIRNGLYGTGAVRTITIETQTAGSTTSSTVNPEEIEKFSRMAEDWWHPSGPCKPLHSMNRLRIPFIRDRLAPSDLSDRPLAGLHILDVGCGAGIVSESLARIGATVTGIDASAANIAAAKLHSQQDPSLATGLTYHCTNVESFSRTECHGKLFDAVVASEVIEHVDNPALFLEAATGLLKDGGSLFLTTINRTSRSWLAAIVAAEYMMRLLPVGTHDWNKFLQPNELEDMLERVSMNTRLVSGMLYIPGLNVWKWIPDCSVNYALHAVKMPKSKAVGEQQSINQPSDLQAEKN